MPRAAAIQVHALAAGGRVAAERFVHSITLADNTIVNPPGAGISLGAVRDVYVVGNAVHFGDAALLEDATAAVELYSVEGVRVADLTVTGEREEVMAAVSADAASAPGDPGVRVDEATVRVPEGDAPMPALRRAATPADD
jgi:nitrous oxidase accessory protein NosD